MRRAVICAHPDDESLFFAGAILTMPGDWTVISCSTPARDRVRALKFFDACRVLGAAPRLLPLEESGPSSPLQLEPIDRAALFEFDEIVTHGADGEYGHPHHKQVHCWVTALRAGSVLSRGGPLTITLDKAQAARKLAALQCYDHLSSAGMPTWRMLLAHHGRLSDNESYARC